VVIKPSRLNIVAQGLSNSVAEVGSRSQINTDDNVRCIRPIMIALCNAPFLFAQVGHRGTAFARCTSLLCFAL